MDPAGHTRDMAAHVATGVLGTLHFSIGNLRDSVKKKNKKEKAHFSGDS